MKSKFHCSNIYIENINRAIHDFLQAQKKELNDECPHFCPNSKCMCKKNQFTLNYHSISCELKDFRKNKFFNRLALHAARLNYEKSVYAAENIVNEKNSIINLLWLLLLLRHLLCVLQRSTFSLEQIQTNYLSLCVLCAKCAKVTATAKEEHRMKMKKNGSKKKNIYWKSLSKIFTCSHYSAPSTRYFRSIKM